MPDNKPKQKLSNSDKRLASALVEARNTSLQKQLNPTILGADSTAPSGGMAYNTIGYGKAAKKGNWNAFAAPEDMALKAFEQQSTEDLVYDTVVGGTKRFGAGFLDSIGAWDVSNMTAMAMDKTNVDYSNWFNRLGAKITKDANEENQIYQDPNGSIWNGAYLANQVQQMGYTGGIVAEMMAENILLDWATGGTQNVAAVGKLGSLTNLAKQGAFGMLQATKEAHMNTLETQNNTYEKFKSLGFSDDVALTKSREAANTHFKTEMSTVAVVNGLQNMLLMGALNKGTKFSKDVATNMAAKAFGRAEQKGISIGLSDAVSEIGERALGGITKNKIAQKVGAWGLVAGSEAIEEGVQTGIGTYSQRKVQGLNTSWSNLWEDHEMRDSMIGGALGGLLLGAGFKAVENYRNKQFNKEYKEGIENMQNFSANLFNILDSAEKSYQDSLETYKKSPTPENKKQIGKMATAFEHARQNAILSGMVGSLSMDYAKGNGSTYLFDMQIDTMKQTLDAVNNMDTDFLKKAGLIDENGKVQKDKIEYIKQNYQKNIDTGLKVKNMFAETLVNNTGDFKIASGIVQAKLDQEFYKDKRNTVNKDLQAALSTDQVYQQLNKDSQRRYLLEHERAGIKKHVSDQNNELVKERLEEIEQELENIPKYTVEEKSVLGSEVNRDNNYSEAYGNNMNLTLAVFDSTKEIVKRSSPEVIKEQARKNVEEAIKKAKTKEEVDQALEQTEKEANIDSKIKKEADAKKAALEAKAAVEKNSGVKSKNTPDVKHTNNEVKEKSEPIQDVHKGAISLFSNPNVKITSGTQPENVDESIVNNVESWSQDKFNKGEYDSQYKEQGEALYNYLDNKLGKESTFKDMVEDFIKSVGIKETQDILEGLKKASELVGREITDVSNLLSPVRSFVDFHKSITSNTSEEVNPDNHLVVENPNDATGMGEVVSNNAVERGTGTGLNKLAIYNDQDRTTGKYRQAETLPGFPEDNTLRYSVSQGDYLYMDYAPDYENTTVAVIDKSNPNDPHRAPLKLTFTQYMEWITTPEASKYGHIPVEKNSPEWTNIWRNKVPLVYYQIDSEGNITNNIVSVVHDTEWWHTGNVSHLTDPHQIALEGALSTAQERTRFFEGKKLSQVKTVKAIGQVFFLSKFNEETQQYESNVNTGEMSISLEDATGDTRIGFIENSNQVTLEDGTVIDINKELTNRDKPFISKDGNNQQGSIVEVRKVRDINGKPVYYIGFPMKNDATKGEPLNDSSFNIVKALILAKLYNTTNNQELKQLLKDKYNVDANTVQQINQALEKAGISNLKGNFDSIISNFILTSKSVDPSENRYSQFSIGYNQQTASNFFNIAHNGEKYSMDFKGGNLERTSNFLEILFGQNNDGALRGATVNLDKAMMRSKGEMFTVSNEGNIQSFKSKHGQNTYSGFVKSILQTSVKSFPSKELDENGKPLFWITDVQPMVYVTNSVEQLKVEQAPIEVVQDSQVDINDTASSPIDINNILTEEQIQILRDTLTEEEFELYMNSALNTFDVDSEARNIFTDEQAKELGILRIPGISNRELSHVGDFLFNSVLATIQPTENKTVKPKVIYNRLMSSPEQFLLDKIKRDREIAENLSKNEATKPLASKFEQNANKLQTIVDNKDILLERLKMQLDELLGVEYKLDSIYEGYLDDNGDYVNDVFEEDFDFGEQLEADYSKMNTEKDVKLTYSTALKIAFAGIDFVNTTGQKVSGEFNLPIHFNINEVSDLIKALSIGLPSNTEMMLKKLNEVASQNGNNKMTQVIAREMYNRLSQAPEHIKNEMLYKLAQQKLSMEMVIYSTDNSGRYTLRIQNTNSNSDNYRIREQWKTNFIQGNFIESKDGLKILNKQYLANFYTKLENLHKNGNALIKEKGEDLVKKQVYELLKELGITIGENTFNNYYNTKGPSIITGNNDILGILTKTIKPLLQKEGAQLSIDKDENLFLENTINNILNTLADTELQLNSILATPSQRIAGKSFPGTSMRIMLDDIIDKLMSKDSKEFKFLKSIPYSQKNFLLDIIENTDFVENIKEKYVRVSPEAIKEQGKKTFGDLSIDKLSDTDHILAQLAFFIDNNRKELITTSTNFSTPNIKFRVGKMFSPSLSDKGQMVAISTALMNLKSNNFDINGNDVQLNNEVIDFMLTNLFDSEFDRIIHSYNNSTNITKYEDSNKFFITIPEFNNIDIDGVSLDKVLLSYSKMSFNSEEDKTKALEGIYNTARLKAKDVLSSVINANLKEKINIDSENNLIDGTWIKSGILSYNDKGEPTLKYIDTNYSNNKAQQGDTLNAIQKAKISALDFIANQYLFQSNIYQLYIGDPALYAPSRKAYIDSNGNLNAYALSKATMESINKRVAALIAPGSVLANSVRIDGVPTKYIQIMVNDVEAPSSIIEEYIKMVNNGVIPKEQEQYIKDYNSENNDLKKKAINELKKLNPTIAEYFNIEGTDAQEYTTWKEHLDVLVGQGRITIEDRERFTQNILNDTLTNEDLAIILNPLKPVYAGLLQDEVHKVNRFVYVKSSSFPLLPQLTRGLKLDKVRLGLEAMEKESGQNVRMSYQTANKVGSVNTNLNMSDFYNLDINDIDNFVKEKLKPNSLELNRNSFKVQQDTPYKAKKYAAKNMDTHTTMGSQMTKNILGAGINTMGNVFPNIFPKSVLSELGIEDVALLSGADLDKIKTHVESEYMKLQTKNLEKELGLSPTESYQDLSVDKKKRVFENLVNILKKEIKTRQYDKSLLKELEIDETGLQTVVPIWLTNNADKFESLFLSVIKNRFISIKLPGNGHIVGSSEGFERIDDYKSISQKDRSGIIWIDPNHRGDLKATYITTKDGKKVVNEAEVLVQSHYNKKVKDPDTGKVVMKKINLLEEKDENGKLIYVTLDENGFYNLNLDKIDNELLSNFSFRIPTSAHQSGAILKVVGFLPENMGDLLIVPDEHTKQIGEDFDIDKRYVYKSNYYLDSNKNIRKSSLDYETTNTDIRLQGLENAMIDIYKSVYTSPSEEVQQKIFRILSMQVAEDTAKLIDEAKNIVDQKNFTILSDDVQRKLLKSGTSGKLGTAMHSNAVTFQAQLERLPESRKLVIRELDKEGNYQPKHITIGRYTSDGKLGRIETLDGNREVNAVHAENQNSAVDNVKANIMAKRNENSYTMPVLIQLTLRQFDQDTLSDGTKVQLSSFFLAQPILFRYVELLEESKSLTSEFSKDREEQVIEQLFKEFKYMDGHTLSEQEYEEMSQLMTADELYNNLKGDVNNLLQQAVLRKFLDLKQEAEQTQDIQRILSLSSGGLGKSYFDVLSRIDALNALPNSSIENATALIGEYVHQEAYLADPENYKDYMLIGDYGWRPTTSEGVMLLNSLRSATQIMDVNYPYNRDFLNLTLNKTITEKGTPLRPNQATEFKWRVLKSLKDALQSTNQLGYFIGSIEQERNRLFTQTKEKESLAQYISRIKQERLDSGILKYPLLNNNGLLKALDIKIDNKLQNNINIIKHANLSDIELGVITKNEYFLQMLDDNTTSLGFWNGEQMTPRKLAQDLASYAYLANQENGAIGFRQFIDIDYLKSIGYDQKLREVINNYANNDSIIDTFVKQYYQHNPEQAKIFSENNFNYGDFGQMNSEANNIRNNNPKNITGVLSKLTSFSLISEEKPKFIAVRDTSIKYSDNKYKLFEKIDDEGNYKQISVLGTFGYNEYNLDNYNQTSLLTNKKFEEIVPQVTNSLQINPTNTYSVDINEIYNTDNVHSLLASVLQNSSDANIHSVGKFLEEYLDYSTSVEIVDFKALNKTGQAFYRHGENKIYINSQSFIDAQKAAYSPENALQEMNANIIEELLHSVQVQALKEYGTIDSNKQFIPDSNAPIFVTKLVALYNQAKEALPYDPSNDENYESKDIFEFMAGVFEHRGEYRSKLDSIKDSKGKSLLQRIKETIGQFIQFITDNYSSEVKQTVIELMDSYKGRNTETSINTFNPTQIAPTVTIPTEVSNKVERPIIDKSRIKSVLDQTSLKNEIQDVMKNITDISSLSPEKLLSLLQEKGIVKKEC